MATLMDTFEPSFPFLWMKMAETNKQSISTHPKYTHVKLISNHGFLLDLIRKNTFFVSFQLFLIIVFIAMSFMITNGFTISKEPGANLKFFGISDFQISRLFSYDQVVCETV